uniref:Transmembrane protein n=1 Tax=Strongyloides venezuelensis TaxID=75913 RepID=A0A0K0EU24_STRVS
MYRKIFYIILQPIIILLVLKSTLVKSSQDTITRSCISKAGYVNCKTFNNCCDTLCGGSSNDNTCISILGKIDDEQSHCQCATTSSASSRTSQSSQSGSNFIATKFQSTTKTSLSKIDLIIGVLLLFIIDLLFLSLTF